MNREGALPTLLEWMGANTRSFPCSLNWGSSWLRKTNWNLLDFFGSIQCFFDFLGCSRNLFKAHLLLLYWRKKKKRSSKYTEERRKTNTTKGGGEGRLRSPWRRRPVSVFRFEEEEKERNVDTFILAGQESEKGDTRESSLPDLGQGTPPLTWASQFNISKRELSQYIPKETFTGNGRSNRTARSIIARMADWREAVSHCAFFVPLS